MKYRVSILFFVLIPWFAVVAEISEVEFLISKNYPNHRQQNNDKFIVSVKESLGEELEAPTSIMGDFDGNELHDYAVILEGQILVVFRQISKGEFKPYELKRQDWVGDFISELKSNSILKQYDTSYSIKLKYSAILSTYYLKSSAAYYWDEETLAFKELWLSD